MTTYRVEVSDALGRWGVSIVREPDAPGICADGSCPDRGDHPSHDQAQLVVVVVNGDQALAERICALLNGVDGYPHACLGCGKHYRTPDAAAECDADHRAHAERIRAKRGDR